MDNFMEGAAEGKLRSVLLPNGSEFLIRKAQQGDFGAFQELVRGCELAVWQTAIRIAGSGPAAAEIYRRTFLRAYLNIVQSHFECSFQVWVFRHLSRLCLEHLRQETMLASFPDSLCTTAALRLLTPRERMIAELKFGQGLPFSVVEEILDIPEELLRRSLLRAREKLRKGLNAEPFGADDELTFEEVT